jgi:hypothetical protein
MSDPIEKNSPNEPSKAIIRAISRLLRPLIRLLIAQGITFPTLSNMLKALYVEAADKHFRVDRKRQTDSRISLITGVHRKDVKRLRSEADASDMTPAAPSIGAQMIGLWLGNRVYLDDQGRPKPLPRSEPHGGGVSFEGLVESISKDLRPRTVLDEWLRLGLVSIDQDNVVTLNSDAFVPNQDFDQMAHYFGRNTHDHIAAAVHNLSGDGAPYLERSVFYDGLTPQSVKELHAQAREVGMEALVALNKTALEKAKQDEGKPDATQRMNFGIYFYDTKSSNADHQGSDEEED